MKTAVVVGANGFLGSALVNKLLDHEVEVIAVYNANYDKINPKAKRTTHEELLQITTQPDAVFYLSGNYANSHAKLLEINDTLYHYTLRFPQTKMVYISSTNVYGSNKEVVTEQSAYVNPGLYAQSKLAGEFIVKAMTRYAIVRLAYIYGPGITNTSFIPSIIAAAKTNKKITLFGNGEREQDYIYIDDAVSLCVASAMQQQNDTYLGATGIAISNKQVAEEVQKHTNCTIEYTGIETGQSFYCNPEHTFKALQWQPQTPFSEGMKHMLL